MIQVIKLKQGLKILAIVLSLFSFNVNAQSDLGSYFLKNTWAAAQVNPSFTDSAKLQISLPILQYQIYHSPDVNFSDVLFQKNGRNLISLDGVLDKLEAQNDFESSLDFQSLGISLRLNKFNISLSHRIRFQSQLIYPDVLAKLVFDGNSQYIGEEVEFDPQIFMNSFHAVGIGGQYKIADRLSFGLRVNLLSGIGAIKTLPSKASLYTSDDIYQLSFDVDYALQAASFVDINGVSDFNFNFETLTFSNFDFANNGLSFDFGANYQVNEKLNLSLSVIDLGTINWKDNVNEYRSQGVYDYEGVDLSNFFADEEFDLDVKLDTLEQIFEFEKLEGINFETNLNSSFYLGADYEINENIQVGILYRNIFGNELNRSSFALNGQYRIKEFLSVGAHFVYNQNRSSSFGIMGLAKLGPVQIYGSTDSVLGFLSNSNNLNGRIGIALLF